MFDDYFKKINDLTGDATKVFRKVAIKGATFFENMAKEKTTEERLVDTGNYRRNWVGEAIKVGEDNAILGSNGVEYASHLEFGHKLRNGGRWQGRFVGDRSLQETAYHCITEFDKAWQRALKKR